jgi:signal transduction histidine kinase
LQASTWVARLTATPLTAGLIAFALLALGLVFAFQIDRLGRAERLQQATVQVEILASGIAAPLAFDDDSALQEYLNALRADPQIVAVGAYDADGKFVAGYSLPPATLPSRGQVTTPVLSSRDLVVTSSVTQGSTRLGSVYMHTTLDSWAGRVTRYLGIALIVAMASLLVAVLGASYASLREAHNQLQEETASREQAEEALRQSQKMEALGQLTGGVAHDFNNLLMVAAGSLDLMDRTTDPAKLDRLKAGIRQAVDRGAKLTQQLLAFSRRSSLNAEVIDLGEHVRAMDVLLDRVLSDRVTMEMQLAPDLWPVDVDASQLEVAMLNIALNARDAMPEGGVIRISAENVPGASEADDMVRLSITDTGTGIAPEQVSKIFEPFYTTKGVGQGTGLGLSQVYGFARASGGEVEVTSELGKGATISLLLPRSLLPPAQSVAPAVLAEFSGKGRILLVEDDDIVAEMVGGMLGEIGYESERAINGDAAMDRLERGADFSMMLSDMIMPGKLGGIDLVRAVAQRWPQLPTLLMTGYSTAASEALNEGVRVVTKPFTIQKLSAEIDVAQARVSRGAVG